jgi:protocatechuate 3,4-dioxygenase beta subunit
VAKHDQPGATRISFRAKGFVPKVLKLDANTDPGPLQVVLQTGRSLRLRVVDQTGRPVSQADVIADLEGTASATLASTDAEGKATVHVAADGGTAAYISAAGFKSASVAAPAADGEERTIALAKEARVAVSGAVTDASTGQPLPAFRIVCGTPYVIDPSSANPPFTVSPRSGDWHKFGGGKFRLAMDQFLEYNWDARNRGFMLKFEADGYASSVSRLIHTNESDVQLEVALVPAQTVNVTVLNPDGRPAADADVGLLRPGVTMSLMVAGHLNLPGFSTGLLRPDSKGAFLLPPDDSIKRVIAINSQGFAEASFAALSREPILQLQPLGRLEGQWLVRNQPAPGRGLVLGVASIDGAGYTLDCSATTDSEGRFTFAQVPAGKYRLTWNESTKENGVTTSKDLAGVEVRPGETSTVTVGGYVVNLRLRWPADFVPGKSTRISVAMHTPSLAPPATIMQDRQAVIQWSQSPEIQAKLRDYRSYEFVEGAGGLWTAEPVQAGTAYTLEAMVGDGAATNGSPALVAYGQMSVTIPADPPTGQFDAGELLVQSVESAPARAGVR